MFMRIGEGEANKMTYGEKVTLTTTTRWVAMRDQFRIQKVIFIARWSLWTACRRRPVLHTVRLPPTFTFTVL